MKANVCAVVLLAGGLMACQAGPEGSSSSATRRRGRLIAEKTALLKADFRYSPPWWQTAIGLPDDWQKTLVSKEGALLYDYPGDFSGFGTKVAIALEGAPGETRPSQSMDNPRVPVVETVLADAAGE